MISPNDANGDALRRMEAEGDDLTRPRDIEFTVVFPNEESTKQFVKHIRTLGYEASAELSETVEGFPWDVIVVKNMVPSHGRAGVSRGKKAFDVHANTYRVDADVIAAFAHRMYQKRSFNLFLNGYVYPFTEPEGTQFLTEGAGNSVVNWPEQHYTNGVTKNKASGFRFKSCVRALKNLKYDMEANGNTAQKQAAKQAPSYLLECLVYNVPVFADAGCYLMVRDVIVFCYNATKVDENCKSWLEVNELKWLFHASQPWTRSHANTFLLHAWQYGEFS